MEVAFRYFGSFQNDGYDPNPPPNLHFVVRMILLMSSAHALEIQPITDTKSEVSIGVLGYELNQI